MKNKPSNNNKSYIVRFSGISSPVELHHFQHLQHVVQLLHVRFFAFEILDGIERFCQVQWCNEQQKVGFNRIQIPNNRTRIDVDYYSIFKSRSRISQSNIRRILNGLKSRYFVKNQLQIYFLFEMPNKIVYFYSISNKFSHSSRYF